MNDLGAPAIGDAEIATYGRDGGICVRGAAARPAGRILPGNSPANSPSL